MKKVGIKILLILLALIITLGTTYVLAAEPTITIEGDSTADLGETKTVTVKINTDGAAIGVVSGTIEYDSNITNIAVTAKNGWNLILNEQTGVFNIYKAEGATSEEIMDIQYTVADTEGTATITISNIDMTDVEYTSTTPENISKEITIAEQEEPQDNNNTIGNTTTGDDNNTNNNVNQNSATNNNNANSNRSNTAISGNSNNSSTSNKVLPYTGQNMWIIIGTILLIAIIGVVCYIKYKKYRKI